MEISLGKRWGARVAFASAALLNAAYVWAGPLVVKPLSLSNASQPAVELMANILLGSSANISIVPGSIQYIGAASASGQFVTSGLTDASTTVGIPNGIVLTTGDARFVTGSSAFAGDLQNKNVGFTSGIGNALTRNTAPGNSLFAGVTTAQTYNASILSFQFVPSGSSISLTYVFGSEDYNTGVNSPLPTDVIAFVVNGANYAVVPGTAVPVSAATVNCGGPTNGVSTGNNPQNCALYRDNAPFFGQIETELNGLTVPLQMTAPVIPGQVNTIQIGIANTFDTFYDSAVFIQAGSLRVSQ
jgi:hypothetical protein